MNYRPVATIHSGGETCRILGRVEDPSRRQDNAAPRLLRRCSLARHSGICEQADVEQVSSEGRKRGKAAYTFAADPLTPSLTTLVAIFLWRLELAAIDPPPNNSLCSCQLRAEAAQLSLLLRGQVNLCLPRLRAQARVYLFEATPVRRVTQQVDAP